MKLYTILATACLSLLITFSAHDAQAAGYLIDDTTALFTTTFEVDAFYGGFELPILADDSVTYTDRVDVAGYQITNQLGIKPEIISASGILLSEAPVQNNKYVVATSTVESFTLLTVVKFSAPVADSLTLTVTKLPFWVDGRRTTVHEKQLNDIPVSEIVL